MVKVTVDLIPFGTGKPETIAEYKIWNDMSHEKRPEWGNYQFIAKVNMGGFHGMLNDSIKNHRRSDGINKLLYRVTKLIESRVSEFKAKPRPKPLPEVPDTTQEPVREKY